MAPKITKLKKVFKALVVSTPTTVKGDKRKSKIDPNKDKGKRKKSEKESTHATTLEQNEL